VRNAYLQQPHKIVKIMCYNILADRLASIPKFVKYVPEAVRDFEFRSRRIVGEIMNSNSDIVCLQEVDNFEEYYQEKLSIMGYQILFRPKEAELEEQRHGCAIAFKTDVFQLISQKWIELNDMLLDMSLTADFKRDNHALFCLFQHMPSHKYMVVCNTHLFHDPRWDYVKHAQAAYLLMQAAKYVRESFFQLELMDSDFAKSSQTNLPFVFAGDFNSQPCSSVMSLFHSEDIKSTNHTWESPWGDNSRVKDLYLATDAKLRTW
jgi:mRNA deadenylase 3'-5' endonuclease subunit Ccr4